MKTTLLTLVTGIALTIAALPGQANTLFTLQNLERERATLLKTYTNTQLSTAERQANSERLYRRLVDAERMVLRDDRIATDTSMLAKKAFDHYELTFLVHASAEDGNNILEHWLNTLKLSNGDILNTRVGFK